MRRSENGRCVVRPLLERFMAKVRRAGDDECWLWLGARTGGWAGKTYGEIRVNGTVDYAHRVSYRLFVGAIPKGEDLDHLCDNPLCVNPRHLQPKGHAENIARSRRWVEEDEDVQPSVQAMP